MAEPLKDKSPTAGVTAQEALSDHFQLLEKYEKAQQREDVTSTKEISNGGT